MMIICSGPLEQLHTMMGFDEGLMATILEPEACKEFFEAIIDYKIEMLEGILEYYPLDIVEQHDDYGHNNNSFISLDPVSYTHLDVYKRQYLICGGEGSGLQKQRMLLEHR